MIAGVIVALAAAPIRAQAWLPPKGEATFSLGYGSVFVNKHYLGSLDNPGDSVESDYGHIRSQSVGLGFSYGVADSLAVAVGLPFVDSKFYGGGNLPAHCLPLGSNCKNPVDDGHYHGTVQDYRVDVSYQAWNGIVAVAPFVAAVIPSHSYTSFAHSAPGRDLHEYLLGVSSGTRLDRLVAGSYVELTYSYAFVERVMNIRHDRSDFALEVGYYLTPSLGMRGIGTGTYTHGGVAFESPESTPLDLFPVHDQIAKTSGISVGGGLTYTLTGATTLYASYLTQVQGRGGHKIKDSFSFGMSYSFSPQQLVRRAFPPKRLRPTETP